VLQQLDIQNNEPDAFDGSPDEIAVRTIHRLPILRYATLLALSDVLGILLFTQFLAVTNQFTAEAAWSATCGSVLIWLLVTHSLQLYDKSGMLGALRTQLISSAVPVGLAALLIFALTPRTVPLTGRSKEFLIATLSVIAWVWILRILWQQYARSLLRRGQCLDRALLLTGAAEDGSALCEYLERDTMGEVRIAAVAHIPERRGNAAFEWIENVIRMGSVDRVFVAGFGGLVDDTNVLLRRLSRLAVDVTLMPDLAGIEAPALHVDRIGPRPVVDVNRAPLSSVDAVLKRLEDLVILMAALPLFALLTVVIAVAVKLDSPGPVFFRQWRAGFHDKRFRMWKFRTMYHHLRDDGSARQTGRTDRRVTRVGRILRRTSLDELPQLLNVLTGDMSIVGPRPHALAMTTTGQPMHEVVLDYPARHRVKPGITGWAQVSGCRGEVDTAEKLHNRVVLDCYYIEHWSLAFDLWIILRTAGNILFAGDAY
jgi:Undecaprenyl-phosphate glucose phosphotransferase